VTLYATLIQILAGAALAAGALTVLLVLALLFPPARSSLAAALAGQARHPISWAWAVATFATLGSLYLSEVVGFVPCSLCWYQRIAMYPLVFVLGAGIVRADPSVWRYAIPLPVVGAAIATYHVVIQLQPTLDVGVCSTGASCTGRSTAVFCSLSLPVAALAGCLLIAALLVVLRVIEREEIDEISTARGEE